LKNLLIGLGEVEMRGAIFNALQELKFASGEELHEDVRSSIFFCRATDLHIIDCKED
jgi:hypothetical protein